LPCIEIPPVRTRSADPVLTPVISSGMSRRASCSSPRPSVLQPLAPPVHGQSSTSPKCSHPALTFWKAVCGRLWTFRAFVFEKWQNPDVRKWRPRRLTNRSLLRAKREGELRVCFGFFSRFFNGFGTRRPCTRRSKRAGPVVCCASSSEENPKNTGELSLRRSSDSSSCRAERRTRARYGRPQPGGKQGVIADGVKTAAISCYRLPRMRRGTTEYRSST